MSDEAIAAGLYRATTAVLAVVAPLILRWRLARGKEDAARLGERLGRTDAARPQGPLVWLHGASVGEGLALLPLIAALQETGAAILLTTGTVTSSQVVGHRLPPGAIHQYVPLDTPPAVRRFFAHWRPDLVIFAESELWPNLLGEARRLGVPTILANARMSARSFARWRRVPRFAHALLGRFNVILAQSDEIAARFAALAGHPVASVGNLKFDAAPPTAEPEALTALRRAVGERPVWIAASTHAGEDILCCDVHRRCMANLPDLLTVVVPRRMARGPALAAHAEALGLPVGLRSRGDAVAADTALYVADTMGELGLFYGLGTAVFVGKSLDKSVGKTLEEGRGGQNPIEPAKLGNAILHGPHTANFADIYKAFDAAHAAIRVEDAPALAAAVGHLLTDGAAMALRARNARVLADTLGGATARTMQALQPYIHWRSAPDPPTPAE